MVDIVKTIRDFVSSLDLSGGVVSLSNDGTNTTLLLSNSYHLRQYMIVSIDGSDYEVLSSDAQNNTIVVGGVIASATDYVVPNPFFFWGSFYLANVDFDLKDDEDRLPMFYMNDPIRENWGSYNSNKVTPEFYFLLGDHANYADWVTEDYYEKRRIGLTKLAWAIRDHALKYRKFGTIETDWNIEKLNKLGEYLPNAGANNSLFNHTLTGIGVRVSIPINNCNC